MQIQNMLNEMRTEWLLPTLKQLLINKSSREKTLEYINTVLVLNRNRAQIHPNEKVMAGEGFLFNLTSVLQFLSVKIETSKIDPMYYFDPKNELTKKEETCIKFTADQLKAWLKGLNDDPGFKWNEPSFNTRCFFQTLWAHHLSVIPCQRKYLRRLRIIRELNRQIDSVVREPDRSHPMSDRLQVMKEQMLKFHKAKLCAETTLFDDHFMGRCMQFYLKLISLLFEVINFRNVLPLAEPLSSVFLAFPNWYIEDIADFLLFVLQYCLPVIRNMVLDELIYFIIVIICSSKHIGNPYITAKYIEIFFLVCPSVTKEATFLHQRLVNCPLAKGNMMKALMHFYTEIESTGATSEFYDKFSVRYHISIILKSVQWRDEYQADVMSEVEYALGDFIKFINMLMNDTTFLLDEALVGLKRIHDYNEDKKDAAKWNEQSRQDIEDRERLLLQDERVCRSYLTLAVETVDMLHHLTKTVSTPFLRTVSVYDFFDDNTLTSLFTSTSTTGTCRPSRGHVEL